MSRYLIVITAAILSLCIGLIWRDHSKLDILI